MAKFDIDDDLKVSMGMDISIGEHVPRGTVEITENGTHNVGGYAKADVNVELDPPPLQEKVVLPDPRTVKYVDADDDYYGLSEVIVAPAKMQEMKTVFSSTSEKYVGVDPPEVLLSFYEAEAVNLPYTKEFDFSSLEDGEPYIIDLYNARTRSRYREIFIWESTLGVNIRLSLGGADTFFVSIHSNSISVTSTATTFRPYFEFYKFSDYNMGLEGVDIKPMVLDTLSVYPMTSGQMIGPKAEPIIPIITSETLIESDYTVQLDATLMPVDMVFIIRGTCGVPPGAEMSGAINQKSFVPDQYASSSEKVQRFRFTESSQLVTINFWTDSSHHTLTIEPNETAVEGLYIYKRINDGYNRVTINPIKTADLHITPTKSSQHFSPEGGLITNIIEEATVITTEYTVQLDATLMPSGTDCDIIGNGDSYGEISAYLSGRFKVPLSLIPSSPATFSFDQTGQEVTIQFWTDSSHHTLTIEPGEKAIRNLYISEHGDDGYDYVEVDPIPNEYIVPSGTKFITENGTGIDVTAYAAVDVAVSGGSSTLITKTVTENGTYNASSDNADGYSSVTVNVSSGGGDGSVDSGVIFIDYDGTIVDSYSASEVASLTALPANPTHNGLTSQGWNWSLADIKTYFTNHPNEKLTVGQMYVTSDGKTRIEIELQEGRISPYLSLAVNGTASIDWGDNSTQDTLTGTSLTTRLSIQHVYSSAGEYVITITVTSGTAAFYATSTYFILNNNSETDAANRVYSNAVKNIWMGTNISIGASAFQNCNSLTSVTIPDSVTSIENSAFSYCYSLASITIPNGVTSIGIAAFRNCYSLTSVTIPDSVTSVGNSAFTYCYSLASVTIPDGVMSVGNSAFAYCYSLASITISDSVTSIGNSALRNCDSLTSVTIPDGVTSIGDTAFAYCHSLTSVTIPDSVTSVGNSTFSYCTSLTSVTIPDSVTSIRVSAFANCYSLTPITIPTGVTSIEANAFQNCYSLASVTIPDGVTSIGDSTFSYCYGMAEYHFLPTTPPTLGITVFNSIPSDCIIYVPSASVEAYKAATNWSTYASQIQGE